MGLNPEAKYLRANVPWRWDGEDNLHITLMHPPGRGVIYFLNPTAALIFYLCDGKHSVNDIVQRLSRKHTGDPVRVRSDVISFLAYLEKLGVVRRIA